MAVPIVEIFGSTRRMSELEDNINNFISKHSINADDIINISFSSTIDKDYEIYYSALLVYKLKR